MAIRVLHITGCADGGAAVVVANLAKNLDRTLYEPVIFLDTYRDSITIESLKKIDITVIRPTNRNKVNSLQIDNQKKPRIIGFWIKDIFGDTILDFYLSIKDFAVFIIKQLPRISLFAKAIRRNKIDLVHIHGDLHCSKPAILASYLCSIPCLLHTHMYRKLTTFDRVLKSFVKHYIYISHDIARHNYLQGLPKDNASIIHNGVEIDQFTRSFDTTVVREEFDVAPNGYLIGMIGRIDWWKGQDYFIHAAAILKEKIPTIKVLVVGSLEQTVNVRLNRKYMDDLNNLVNSLNMKNTVVFTGPRNDIPRLMAGMDVIVHASSEPEPFGLVVLEGMASGKAVVATAGGGVPDIIENDVTGILVPPKNPVAMAAAIERVLLNKHLAKYLGINARNRVMTKFSITHHISSVQHIYDRVVQAQLFEKNHI